MKHGKPSRKVWLFINVIFIILNFTSSVSRKTNRKRKISHRGKVEQVRLLDAKTFEQFTHKHEISKQLETKGFDNEVLFSLRNEMRHISQVHGNVLAFIKDFQTIAKKTEQAVERRVTVIRQTHLTKNSQSVNLFKERTWFQKPQSALQKSKEFAPTIEKGPLLPPTDNINLLKSDDTSKVSRDFLEDEIDLRRADKVFSDESLDNRIELDSDFNAEPKFLNMKANAEPGFKHLHNSFEQDNQIENDSPPKISALHNPRKFQNKFLVGMKSTNLLSLSEEHHTEKTDRRELFNRFFKNVSVMDDFSYLDNNRSFNSNGVKKIRLSDYSIESVDNSLIDLSPIQAKSRSRDGSKNKILDNFPGEKDLSGSIGSTNNLESLLELNHSIGNQSEGPEADDNGPGETQDQEAAAPARESANAKMPHMIAPNTHGQPFLNGLENQTFVKTNSVRYDNNFTQDQVASFSLEIDNNLKESHDNLRTQLLNIDQFNENNSQLDDNKKNNNRYKSEVIVTDKLLNQDEQNRIRTRLMRSAIVQVDNYVLENYHRFKDPNYVPMQIVWELGMIKNQLAKYGKDEEYIILKAFVEIASAMLSRYIRVDQDDYDQIVIPKGKFCGSKFNEEISFETDLLVLVRLYEPTIAGYDPDIIAQTHICKRDPQTNKALVALLLLNPAKMLNNKALNPSSKKSYVFILAHELIHALAFYGDAKEVFQNRPVAERHKYLNKIKRINPQIYDNGHWNEAYIPYDIMVPMSRINNGLSIFSLEMIEHMSDSYRVNLAKLPYNHFQNSIFDDEDFYSYKCRSDDKAAKYKTFCSRAEKNFRKGGCTEDYMYKTSCSKEQLPNGCYINEVQDNGSCLDATMAKEFSFETRGSQSRCFVDSNSFNSYCLKVQALDNQLYVIIGGQVFACLQKDQLIHFVEQGSGSSFGFDLKLRCPDPKEFSELFRKTACPSNCHSNGFCLNGKCVCFKGFSEDSHCRHVSPDYEMYSSFSESITDND